MRIGVFTYRLRVVRPFLLYDDALHPRKRAGLSDRGKQRSRTFDWDAAASKTYDVYRAVARS